MQAAAPCGAAVLLHGPGRFATREMALWRDHDEKDHDHCGQDLKGQGDPPPRPASPPAEPAYPRGQRSDYRAPDQCDRQYREQPEQGCAPAVAPIATTMKIPIVSGKSMSEPSVMPIIATTGILPMDGGAATFTVQPSQGAHRRRSSATQLGLHTDCPLPTPGWLRRRLLCGL